MEKPGHCFPPPPPSQQHCCKQSRSSPALPLPLPLPLPLLQSQQCSTSSSLHVKFRRVMRWGDSPTENKSTSVFPSVTPPPEGTAMMVPGYHAYSSHAGTGQERRQLVQAGWSRPGPQSQGRSWSYALPNTGPQQPGQGEGLCRSLVPSPLDCQLAGSQSQGRA